MANMPTYKAMELCVQNKCVMGFNLSFMGQEVNLLEGYFTYLLGLVEKGLIGNMKNMDIPEVEVFEITSLRNAHEKISSGKSVGKLVVKTAKPAFSTSSGRNKKNK